MKIENFQSQVCACAASTNLTCAKSRAEMERTMGIHNLFKKKEEPAAITFPVILGAPVRGSFVEMDSIADNVFSSGVLGICCGIEPAEGKVYAPADGKISQLTDTLHAIGIEVNGIELLIHVGVDTVEMNGDGFSNVVEMGQIVKKGDLLMTMDLDKIRAANHAATVIMAVTNSVDFSEVEAVASGIVQTGDNVLKVNK